MALARHEVERQAVFLTVLRERTSELEVADKLISEWLDEAEEEAIRILDQARAEAAAVRADVLAMQGRLVELLERATALLPALEAPPRRRRLVRLLRRG